MRIVARENLHDDLSLLIVMPAIAVFFGIGTVFFTSGPAFRIGTSRVRRRAPITALMYTLYIKLIFNRSMINWLMGVEVRGKE
jgi:hypothetical protein